MKEHESAYRMKLQAGRLAIDRTDTDGPAFRVLAISAGEGNGWSFSVEALQQSLAVWEGAACFIDHQRADFSAGRSVRDLAGVCSQPVWDEAANGIAVTLRPEGPAGDLLTRTGLSWLAQADPRPDLGFSADLLFTASGKKVRQILKVFSLDLVIQPARGGRFLDTGDHQEGKQNPMNETSNTSSALEAASLSGMAPEQPIHTTLAESPTVGQAGASVQAQMCALLLETSLATAHLPVPVNERIRTRFAERIFTPGELSRAIEDGRQLAAELLGGSVIQGPGRVTQMVDTRDQLQAACDDLLGAPRETGMEKVNAARLSGIRELYLTLTGDDSLHGGYYPERVRLATTVDFNGLVKNSLNKIVANRWEELGRAGYNWWEKIVTVEHFNTLQQITGTLVGTVGSLPEVNEGAAYTELAIGDSPETADWKKYGGYIPLTLELIDRDETRKLRAYPQELASAGLRKISALVAALFTQNGGVGPAMADGGNLFNNMAVSSAGGHKNLLTGALSATEWETISTAVYNQPLLIKNAIGYYGSGPRQAVNPRYLLVSRALQLTAMKILYPTLENAASIFSENQQRGQPGDVITVPEWTDANDWAAVVDPRIAPAIFIGERFGLMPEIFISGDELSPTVFTNDEHRLKVRNFLTVWVNDYRPLHKSNVA